MYAWHMSLSAVSSVAKNSAHAAESSTKVAQIFGEVFPLKAFSGKLT